MGQHHDYGYYEGTSFLTYRRNENYKPVKSDQARLVFVLGLSGSGKRSFCRANFDDSVVINFMDHEESEPGHCLFTASAMLERGQSVVVCEPWLCSLFMFKAFYDVAVELVASPAAQICVISFDNDEQKCLANVKPHCKRLKDSIRYFHSQYDETIRFIEETAMKTHGVTVYKLPVFSPIE